MRTIMGILVVTVLPTLILAAIARVVLVWLDRGPRAEQRTRNEP